LTGPAGETGATGPQGPIGLTGPAGANGLSAYQIWLNEGNTGTESQFLNQLSGSSASVHGSYTSNVSGSFVVPSGVHLLEISFSGTRGGNGGTASGLGNYIGGGAGGNSGFSRITLPVQSNDLITFVIGDNGINGGDCAANGSCGGCCGGCACTAGAGTNGSTSSITISNQPLIQISGGIGGTGASYGANAYGIAGAAGNVIFSAEAFNLGLIPQQGNVWNINDRTILIRY
jgi:hypothetical protein